MAMIVIFHTSLPKYMPTCILFKARFREGSLIAAGSNSFVCVGTFDKKLKKVGEPPAEFAADVAAAAQPAAQGSGKGKGKAVAEEPAAGPGKGKASDATAASGKGKSSDVAAAADTFKGKAADGAHNARCSTGMVFLPSQSIITSSWLVRL
jgi:hypothetical protein